MAHILQPVPLGCPDCSARGVKGQGTTLHNCPALAGLSIPLVPDWETVKVVRVEREDYVNGEDVQYDGNGRPVMAIHHERPDGSYDTTVYAPTAHARGRA